MRDLDHLLHELDSIGFLTNAYRNSWRAAILIWLTEAGGSLFQLSLMDVVVYLACIFMLR